MHNRERELGLLISTCKYWNWLPGMLLVTKDGDRERIIKIRRSDGYVYLASELEEGLVGWFDPTDSYPDIYDPATLGCTLSLLRFRMKEPTLHLTPDKDGWYINKLSLDGPEWYCGNGMWGLDGCEAPVIFSSQQEAVAVTLSCLDINPNIVH